MQEASLLFPGQGSQVAGMGRDVADAYPEAMDLWKKAESISSLPLREIYWEGDEAAMSNTRSLQPALVTAEIALWSVLSRKVKASACAGHSLGEYAALCASGILDVESTLNLVSLRGALMAECDPDGRGAMAAIVKLPLEKVEALVAEVKKETGLIILVANYNTPGQYVVSGEKEAVAMVGTKAKAIRGRALPLAVSGAFHSPCMQKAADELVKMLKKVTWRRPTCPFYCNVTAGAIGDGESARDVMIAQMTSPVRWIDLMKNEYADGQRHFLEVGPKAVLSKMVTRCLENATEEVTTGNVVDLATAEAYGE